MKPVDNHMIAEIAEVVFSNSAGYYVELPMVGRERETSVLLDVLADRGQRRAVTVTAPLGAGKTFFLNTVLGLHRRVSPDFDERRNRKVMLATEVRPPPAASGEIDHDGIAATAQAAHDGSLKGPVNLEALFEGVVGQQVLMIEELDRKATLGQIRWSVASGVAWLARRPDRVLILTGDMTIGGRHVGEFLQGRAEVVRLALSPLDVDLLNLALRARIHDKLLVPANPNAPRQELEETAAVAADQILSDSTIRWSVTPGSDPPLLATFRESLGVLRTYAENAPSHVGSVLFERSLISNLYNRPSGLAGYAQELEQALVAATILSVERDEALSAYTLEELAELAAHKLNSSYRKRVVRALARKSLLIPLGIPYEEEVEPGEEPTPFVGPFLPSYRLLHVALNRLLGGGG